MEKNKKTRMFYINVRNKSYGEIEVSGENHITELLHGEPVMTERIKLSHNSSYVFLDILHTEKDIKNKIPSAYLLGFDINNKRHAYFTDNIIITEYSEGTGKRKMESLDDLKIEAVKRHIFEKKDGRPYLLIGQ